MRPIPTMVRPRTRALLISPTASLSSYPSVAAPRTGEAYRFR